MNQRGIAEGLVVAHRLQEGPRFDGDGFASLARDDRQRGGLISHGRGDLEHHRRGCRGEDGFGIVQPGPGFGGAGAQAVDVARNLADLVDLDARRERLEDATWRELAQRAFLCA